MFPVTDTPDPGVVPENGPSGGGSPSNVNYKYSDVGIELGQIADLEGKGRFLPGSNPLAQVDSDEDGLPDLKDDDDDGDGVSDTADDDANGNGTEDTYESDDLDADGIPDELQAGAQSP